jgi:hypothetical protein
LQEEAARFQNKNGLQKHPSEQCVFTRRGMLFCGLKLLANTGYGSVFPREALVFPFFQAKSANFPTKNNTREGFHSPGNRKT